MTHSLYPRATALASIVFLHGVVLAALVSTGTLRLPLREPEPIQVSLLPAPERRVENARPVPMPTLRPPEVRIPTPPMENLFVMRMEETAPAAATPPPSTPVVASASPSPTPVAAIEPPRGDMAYLNNPAPSYPVASRRNGEHGRVMLRVRVDDKGGVETIELQASSGYPRLDEAALTAVRRWRFVPARQGERAVPGWALVPINFSLHG